MVRDNEEFSSPAIPPAKVTVFVGRGVLMVVLVEAGRTVYAPVKVVAPVFRTVMAIELACVVVPEIVRF